MEVGGRLEVPEVCIYTNDVSEILNTVLILPSLPSS